MLNLIPDILGSVIADKPFSRVRDRSFDSSNSCNKFIRGVDYIIYWSLSLFFSCLFSGVNINRGWYEAKQVIFVLINILSVNPNQQTKFVSLNKLNVITLWLKDVSPNFKNLKTVGF